LVFSLALPRPIIKSHAEEKRAWTWVRAAPQNWGFPFDISVTIEDSDFKIGRLVEFAKAHYNISPKRKRGRGPGLGELPKYGVFHCNIYAMAASIDFKFGTKFGWLIRPVIKSHK